MFDDGTFRGSKNDDLNFKFIALSHLRTILSLGCVEFRGGYWQEKFERSSDGVVMSEKFYIPDSREQYCNSIDQLYLILAPHLAGDFVKKINSSFHQLEKLRLHTLEMTAIDESEILSSDCYGEDDRVILEEYKYKRLRIFRDIFLQMNYHLKSVGYFVGEDYVDREDVVVDEEA